MRIEDLLARRQRTFLFAREEEKEEQHEDNTDRIVEEYLVSSRQNVGNALAIYGPHLDEEEQQFLRNIIENFIGSLESFTQVWIDRAGEQWQPKQKQLLLQRIFLAFQHGIVHGGAKGFAGRKKNFGVFAQTIINSIVSNAYPLLVSIPGGEQIARELHSGLASVAAHAQGIPLPTKTVKEDRAMEEIEQQAEEEKQ